MKAAKPSCATRHRRLLFVSIGSLCGILALLLIRFFLISPPEVLRVGFIGTLTGPQSDLGGQGRNGALFAVEEINARGGINGVRLELVFRDDHNDAARARRAIAELAAEGLPVIISHQTSALAAESLAGIAGSGSILVSATASAERFAGKDDQFIRITGGNVLMMDPLRDHLFEGRSRRRVSAFYDPRNESYALDMVNRLKNTVPGGCALDLEVQRLHPGGAAFGAAAHALRTRNADAAVVIYGPFDAALFAQVARKHGFRGELLSPA